MNIEDQMHWAKFTSESVLEMRHKFASGLITIRGLARELGVDRCTVAAAIFGQNWKNVPDACSRSRPSGRPVTIAGETKSLAAWARKIGITEASFRNRLDSGWPEEILLSPATGNAKRPHGARRLSRAASAPAPETKP